MSEDVLTEPLLTSDSEAEFIGNIHDSDSSSCSSLSQSVDATAATKNAAAPDETKPRKDISHIREAFLNPDPSDSQFDYFRDSDLTEGGKGQANQSMSSLVEKTSVENDPSDANDEIPAKTINDEQKGLSSIPHSNKAVRVTCPHCNTTSETTVTHVFGRTTYLWFCVLLVLFVPICWIPFVLKDCHDTKHICTHCSKELGRSKAECCHCKKRMGEELEKMEEGMQQIENQTEEMFLRKG